MPEKLKQTLLIVDDDAPIRTLLRRLAVRAGFEADTAKDGQEALEKLATTQYDIVIIDLMMPRVSGFDLVQRIGTIEPRPTVIVATALMNGDVSKIDDSLIRRVIKKPFDVDAVMKALIETAREVAAGHAVTDVPPVVKDIIPGDPKSQANAAAHHAAAAAAHAAAAADLAAAAAGEAKSASEASPPAEATPPSPEETKEKEKGTS